MEWINKSKNEQMYTRTNVALSQTWQLAFSSFTPLNYIENSYLHFVNF